MDKLAAELQKEYCVEHPCCDDSKQQGGKPLGYVPCAQRAVAEAANELRNCDVCGLFCDKQSCITKLAIVKIFDKHAINGQRVVAEIKANGGK